MNELTTTPKTHWIIFKDRSKVRIPEKDYFDILKDSGNPSSQTFTMGLNMYNYSDIKKLLTPDEYRAQYQEEAVTEYEQFNLNKFLKNKTPERRLKVIEQLAKGLKGYIDSDRYQGTEAPKILLEKMRAKYREIKQEIK